MTDPAPKPRRKTAVKDEAAPVEDATPAAKPAPKAAPKPTDYIFKRRMSQGDHGPAVKEIQSLLAARGVWDGPVDGRYGSMLARAVRVFQGKAGLKVNGEVDTPTWKALSA